MDKCKICGKEIFMSVGEDCEICEECAYNEWFEESQEQYDYEMDQRYYRLQCDEERRRNE